MNQEIGGWAPYIEPDEQILWQGVPSQRLVIFEPRDAYLIPFFLLWGGIPGMAIVADPSVLFLIVPTVFVAIAIWMLAGRFLWDAWLRRATVYLLTDRRVIIAGGRPSARVDQMLLRPGLSVTVEGDSVTFGPHKPAKDRNFLIPDPSFTFREIPEAVRIATRARRAIAALPVAD